MKYLSTYRVFESSDDTSKYQAEYDNLIKNTNDFISKLKSSGYYITKKGVVEKLKQEWGIFWDIEYYDHWANSEWVYEYNEGAKKLKEDQSDAVRELITCWDVLTFDQIKDKLSEALDVGWISCSNLIERLLESMGEYGEEEFDRKNNKYTGNGGFKFTVTDTSFKIEVVDTESDEYTPVNGSWILLKLTSNEEIKATKNKSGKKS